MPRHRSQSIEFKRQVAQDYLAGETLHSLARRYDRSRNLIRIWTQRFEAGMVFSRVGADAISPPRMAIMTCRFSRTWRRACEPPRLTVKSAA